jgi:hypothetical protein
MASADLFWEKSTAGWLLVAGLFWEKSTVGWWLISQTNRLHFCHRSSPVRWAAGAQTEMCISSRTPSAHRDIPVRCTERIAPSIPAGISRLCSSSVRFPEQAQAAAGAGWLTAPDANARPWPNLPVWKNTFIMYLEFWIMCSGFACITSHYT